MALSGAFIPVTTVPTASFARSILKDRGYATLKGGAIESPQGT
jgi:hypothetical protein